MPRVDPSIASPARLFGYPRLRWAGNVPEQVAAADLNGDGYIDFVVALQNFSGPSGLVGVSLGYWDTGFKTPVYYSSGGYWASSVAIGDVNNDGIPDIVVGNYGCPPTGGCGPTTVGVLLGNGDGTFQDVVPYALNNDPATSVAIADLNHDGKPDLIVGTNSLEVLFGNGDGTFQAPVSLITNSEIRAVAVADLNGDGKLDIVACGGRDTYVLLGNGDGTFLTPLFYSPGAQVGQIAVADLNGDNRPDIVVPNYTLGDSTVSVLLNNGDGTFKPAVQWDTGYPSALAVAAADVNGDLKPDLVVANAGNGVSVLYGNGDGTFQSPLTFKTYGADSVAIADVNHDRKPDLLVLDGAAYVDLLVNFGPPSIPTTTTLVSSANPAALGQAVTFTATVSSSGGPPPNGELVTFRNGNTVLGTAPLVSGVASFTIGSLPLGPQGISARYPGDSEYLRLSVSPGVKEIIVSP